MEKLIIALNEQGYNVKRFNQNKISQFFINQSYEEAEKQITNLFVFCGAAHKAAFQAASQKPVTALWKQDYQKALLWRFCIDWPRFLKQPPRADVLKDFLKGKASYEQSRMLLFNDKKKWREDIYKYNPQAYEIYKRAKNYDGEIFEGETGAYTKYENELCNYSPLLRRFMGQIYDSFFYDKKDLSLKIKERGAACVPTARGTLFYQLTYEKNKITSCQIISPTDTHFNKASSFVQRGKKNINMQKEQLALEILGLDPCIEWELK